MGGYYNAQTFEAIARNVIKRYDPSLLSACKAIPIENIIEKHYRLKLEYQYIRNNGRLLGETIFDDTWIPVYDMEKKEYTFVFAKRGTIIIDASLINNRGDGRLRFTCAHELAHWFIHQDIFSGSGQAAAMTKKAVKSSETNAAIER